MKRIKSCFVILVAAVFLTALGGCGGGSSSAPAETPAPNNTFAGVDVGMASDAAGTAVAKIALASLGYGFDASLSSGKAEIPETRGQCTEGGNFTSKGYSMESTATAAAEYFNITSMTTGLTNCGEDGYIMNGMFYVTAMTYPVAGGGQTLNTGLTVTVLADAAATIADADGDISYPAYIILDVVAEGSSVVSSDVENSRIMVESYVTCAASGGVLTCQVEGDSPRMCPSEQSCTTDADCVGAEAPRSVAFDSQYEDVFTCFEGCCVPGQASDNRCATNDPMRYPSCVDDLDTGKVGCPPGMFCDYTGQCLPLCLTDADCPMGSCFNFLKAMTDPISSWPTSAFNMSTLFGIEVPADAGICQCVLFEHCSDGVDNDGDGEENVDCADPDCATNSRACRCTETGMSCTYAQSEFPAAADADDACSVEGADSRGEAWRECDEATNCCERISCLGNCNDPRCAEHPACGNCSLKLAGEIFSCEYATTVYGDCTIGGERDWHCVDYCCRDNVCGDSWSCAEAAEVGGCSQVGSDFFNGASGDNLVCATDIDPNAAPCCVPATVDVVENCALNIPYHALSCGNADEFVGGCDFSDEPEIGDHLTCFDYGFGPEHVGCCVDDQCGFDASCDFALEAYLAWHAWLPDATQYPPGPVQDDRACSYTHFPNPAACDQTSRCCVTVTSEYIEAILSPFWND